MYKLRQLIMNVLFVALMCCISSIVWAQDMTNGADNFYKSDQLTMEKVTFLNQYKMKVVGNLFIPKGMDRNTKNSAIIVGHPMGAVKEQSANLVRIHG